MPTNAPRRPASFHVSFSSLPVNVCSTAIAALAATPLASGGYRVVSFPHALSWSASMQRVAILTVPGRQGGAPLAVAVADGQVDRGRLNGHHLADQAARLGLDELHQGVALSRGRLLVHDQTARPGPVCLRPSVSDAR